MATYPYGFDNCAACGEPWPTGQLVCTNCQALAGESDVDRSLRLAEQDAETSALDIACAVAQAKLDGLAAMYHAAVEAYRQGIIDALCVFARQFVPTAYAVRLTADVDWRWVFDAFVDDEGKDIEPPFMDDDFTVSEVFEPSYLSNLDDFYRASNGYVIIRDREFTSTQPG